VREEPEVAQADRTVGPREPGMGLPQRVGGITDDPPEQADRRNQAHRPAFATSFESAGDAVKYIARQWGEKGLILVDLPGADDQERQANLLRSLDRLADRVASAAPRLLLARDAEPPTALARLRGLLLEVGEEVVGLCCGAGPRPLTAAEAAPLADVLGLLADHRWRPTDRSGATPCGLREHLDGLAGDVA
jgi:hypothetical protein